MTWRWAEEIFHNWRYKERDTIQHPEEWKGQAPHWSLQTGGSKVLPWEHKPPKCLAIKTIEAFVCENQRAGGHQASALKGHAQNTHVLSPIQSQPFEMFLGQTHLPILESLPKRQKAAGALLRDWDVGCYHFCDSVLLCWHQHWQVPCWNPPSNQLVLGTINTYTTVTCCQTL